MREVQGRAAPAQEAERRGVGELDDLGQRQFGVVSRHQALDALGARRFRRSVADRQLVGIGAGVYRLVGAPSTFRQRAMAACLAFGPPVAVSHRSAAALWGYETVRPGADIEVNLPRTRSGRRSGIHSYRVVLPDADVSLRYGIPVTSAGRTLLDLADDVAPAVLERCVDDAIRARQVVAGDLLKWLGSHDRRGHNGAVELRRLLELRSSSGVGDSVGVDRVYRWIVRAGLPVPLLDLAVVVGGRPRRVDLAYPAERVAIEFNGWEFHQMRSRMDADHARTTELQLDGWLVLVVTAAHSEAETVGWIRLALARRASDAVNVRRGSGMLDR